tara:strand:- start:849 stop:1376 length:528 start_codon:yes stop_codon:yes gene_type:complete
MSSKKKSKKKKINKKNDSDNLISATENDEENSTEIEIIDDSQDENNNYEELLDESISEMSSDEENDDKECIYYEKDNFFENKKILNKDNIYVTDDDRITRPILTKYEYVRILTDRIKQLTLGAKPLLGNINNLSDKEIAIEEIKHKVCPFKIERPLPNGQKEVFKLSELIIKNSY